MKKIPTAKADTTGTSKRIIMVIDYNIFGVFLKKGKRRKSLELDL